MYTSSRNSIGVFCGDDVVVGLKIVFVEFVDDVRLPLFPKENIFLLYKYSPNLLDLIAVIVDQYLNDDCG